MCDGVPPAAVVCIPKIFKEGIRMISSGGPGVYVFGDEERAELSDVIKSGHLSDTAKKTTSSFVKR